jgi:hypothetical protein
MIYSKHVRKIAGLLVVLMGVIVYSSVGYAWTAEQIAVIEPGAELSIPECVLVDKANNAMYISNVEAGSGKYWSDDGTGYISLLNPDFTVKEVRWVDTQPDAVINAPKGMTLLGDYLYFNDNKRLMRVSLKDPKAVERVVDTDFGGVNDLVAYDNLIWTSDTFDGKVFAVDPEKGAIVKEIPAPASVNGITFFDGKMFAVSWDLHEVFELDPAGKEQPKAFGLADHFVNLDGIEVLDDGTFIVSDFVGNKVSTISPDRKTVTTLIEILYPADIGLDREKGILYVPQFYGNKAFAFQLSK